MDELKKEMKDFQTFSALNKKIVRCRLCPRLVNFRENVPAKKPYEKEIYYRRPVPGFGDHNAWLIITGLAPAPHGGNRTGRIFTGDLTSKFLIGALHRTGFANQPSSLSKKDGLKLKGCYLNAAVKCAPPENKPSPQECSTCFPYFQNELLLLTNVTHVLALGKLAFDTFLRLFQKQGYDLKGCKFEHGKRYFIKEYPLTLYASYHPSPRNTNTGTLTEKSFAVLLQKIKNDHQKNA